MIELVLKGKRMEPVSGGFLTNRMIGMLTKGGSPTGLYVLYFFFALAAGSFLGNSHGVQA